MTQIGASHADRLDTAPFFSLYLRILTFLRKREASRAMGLFILVSFSRRR